MLTGVAAAWSAARGEGTGGRESSGLALMVASAAAFALMAAMVKLLIPEEPIQAVVLSRGILMASVFAIAARRRGISLRGHATGKLVLRGLLGYGALSCYFFSVQHLPLGDAVLIQYSHPLFVAALAPILIGERTERGHWWLVAASLVGVALIVGPQGSLRGAAFVGLTGSLLSGLAYMTVRELSRTEHPLAILFWFPLVSIPGALVASIAAGREALPTSPREVAGHLAVFASALVGQVALTAGLARVAAARATAVSLMGPVFGVLFGLALFGTMPTPFSLAGMAIVVTALIRLARRTT
jgi:drug/metabolite transporter (DMT)-like permease